MKCKNCTRGRFLIIAVLASALYFHAELKQVIPTSEVTIDGKKLLERKGVYYKKLSEIPFSGRVTGEEQGIIKNGKKEGSWVGYTGTGELYSKESYIGGKKESPTIRYYPNGEIQNKGNIKNAKREGDWVWYFDNGQLKERGNYKNGKSEGAWVWYHKNGQLQFKGNYKNWEKEGAWVGYSKDGTVWENGTGTFKNGKKISD